MLTKLRTLASLYRQAGFRWSAFRVAYAFRLRTELIRLQMPQYKWTDRPLETWLKKNIPSTPESYTQWRKQNSPKFFFEPLRPERSESSPSAVEGQWNQQQAIDEANRILSGEIKYFSHEFHQTGFPPHWHSAPGGVPAAEDGGLSKVENKHWSQISDDGAVDIKFIWEPSRHNHLTMLAAAYAATVPPDEIVAELARRGEAAVIVVLRDTVPLLGRGSAARRSRRAVRQRQTDVLGRLAKGEFRLRHRYRVLAGTLSRNRFAA